MPPHDYSVEGMARAYNYDWRDADGTSMSTNPLFNPEASEEEVHTFIAVAVMWLVIAVSCICCNTVSQVSCFVERQPMQALTRAAHCVVCRWHARSAGSKSSTPS